MDIVVCVKRVPDVSEADVALRPDGRGIVDDDLTWATNEWDDYAVEEAVRLKEAHGGTVRVLTVGDEEAEEVLRRALAMGADSAEHLQDEAFDGSDALGIARILAAAIRRAPFDLVFTGAVTGDDAGAQVGGLLAALLDVPQVSLATQFTWKDGKAEVQHEVEGGLERVVELDTPAVVSVQTGINEPRYVSIRGIRKVAGVDIPLLGAADLGVDAGTVGEAGAVVTVESFVLPPTGEGAEILEGNVEEAVATLAQRLREKGGI